MPIVPKAKPVIAKRNSELDANSAAGQIGTVGLPKPTTAQVTEQIKKNIDSGNMAPPIVCRS